MKQLSDESSSSSSSSSSEEEPVKSEIDSDESDSERPPPKKAKHSEKAAAPISVARHTVPTSKHKVRELAILFPIIHIWLQWACTYEN